ncbi:glutaredoxin family protein [Microbacterium sp. F2]|uniref:glutaredoxin family protein n=1 Tax=Microbacterium sp. F2 TaxID=3422228 RepID=UPI003FD42D8B
MSGVIVYGKPECPDYGRVREGFTEAAIDFHFIDVAADGDAAREAERLSGGVATPVVLLEDGTIAVEPDNAEIARLIHNVGQS